MKIQDKEETKIIEYAKYLIFIHGIHSIVRLNRIIFFTYVEEFKRNEFIFLNKEDKFQAWILGPTSREVYKRFSNYFRGLDEEESILFLDEEKILEFDIRLKQLEINRYIHLEHDDLIFLSRQNKSWVKKREGLSYDEPSLSNLDTDEITEFKDVDMKDQSDNEDLLYLWKKITGKEYWVGEEYK